MELIGAVSAAFALGAGATVKQIGSDVLGVTYSKLKKMVVGTHPTISESILLLEKDPDSAARRALLEEEFAKVGLHDEDILKAAQKVLDIVTALDEETAKAAGISITDVRGASLRIADVISQGSGVEISRSDFSGDVSIEKVRSGNTQDSGKRKPKKGQ